MKKLFSLITLFFIGIFVAHSQEVKTTEFPMKESSLLWKIEGQGIDKPSYLFGTMHLIEKEYFLFPDKLEKIIKKSDQVVMEIAGEPSQAEALKMVMLKEGSFFDYFNKEQTDSILNWAKKELNMDETAFRATMNKMKPFVVVQMATLMQFMGKTESYEKTIENIANESKIEIKGFETAQEQMAIFDNMTKEQQTEMVMEGIRDTGKSLEVVKSMEKMYVRQNVDSLYLMVQEDGGILSQEQAILLDNRNENWIPKIVEMVADKKTFIAVGAAHLGGPNGVIRLLQEKGYILTPVEL